MEQVTKLQAGVVIENTNTGHFFVILKREDDVHTIELSLLEIEKDLIDCQEIDFSDFDVTEVVIDSYDPEELRDYIADGRIKMWIENNPFDVHYLNQQLKLAA